MKANIHYEPEIGDKITDGTRLGTIMEFRRHCSNCERRFAVHWGGAPYQYSEFDDIELGYLGNWDTSKSVWTLTEDYHEDHC